MAYIGLENMTSLSRHIGANVKRVRKATGLTQQALAEKASVAAATISRLERGLTEHPRGEEFERIATALGTTPAALARVEAEPVPAAIPDPLIERLYKVFGPHDTNVITDWLDETRDYAPEDRVFTVRAVEWLQAVMRGAREYREGRAFPDLFTPAHAR